ncbi:MAG TPA: sugar phosphate isomerase/epimerase family protein, partial [Geminicoccaceae bacterium]
MRDLADRLDLLSLNGATVRERWRLPEIVDGCARHGFGGIAPWRDQLQVTGTGTAARLIRDAGLRVSGLCRGGLLTAPDDAGRRAAIDDNRRAIDEAAQLDAECLVMLAGGLPGGSKDLWGAWRQVEDGFAAILPHARAAAVPLAIEPLHPMYAADRCCVNLLSHALDLCERLDPENQGGIGVAIDV